MLAQPGTTVSNKDAFQDVSDTHPFHLPHVFDTCNTSTNCVLSTITVTMPVLKVRPCPTDRPTDRPVLPAAGRR